MRMCAAAATAALAVSMASFIPAAHAAGSDLPFVQPSVSTGSCVVKKSEIAAADTHEESDSVVFVNVGTAGAISFKQARAGCVAGTFYANAGNDNEGDNMVLQVLLDNTPCAPLTDRFIFANAGLDFSSHAVEFFCGANIQPGTHRIQVQYSSGLGGTVEIYQRSLVVNHS